MYEKPVDSFLTEANKKLQEFRLSKPYTIANVKIKRCYHCEQLKHDKDTSRYFCKLGGFKILSVSTCDEFKEHHIQRNLK